MKIVARPDLESQTQGCGCCMEILSDWRSQHSCCPCLHSLTYVHIQFVHMPYLLWISAILRLQGFYWPHVHYYTLHSPHLLILLRYQDHQSLKCSHNWEWAHWTEAEFTYYYIYTTTCLFRHYIFLQLNCYLPHHSAITDIIIHTYYLHYSATFCTVLKPPEFPHTSGVVLSSCGDWGELVVYICAGYINT